MRDIADSSFYLYQNIKTKLSNFEESTMLVRNYRDKREKRRRI